MDGSTIHTQITAQPQKGKANNTPQGNAFGVFAQNTDGQSFLDLLFGQIGQSTPSQLGKHLKTQETANIASSKGNNDPSNLVTNTQSTLSSQTALNPLADALSADTSQQSEGIIDTLVQETSDLESLSEQVGTIANADSSQTDALAMNTNSDGNKLSDTGLTKLKEIIDHLLQGTPGENLDIMNLRHLLQNNHSLSTNIDIAADNDASIVATNLTPAALTDLLENLEEGTAYLIGLVKILPPQAQREKILLPRAIAVPQNIASNEINSLNGTSATQGPVAPDAESLLNPLVNNDNNAGGNTESILPKPNGFTKALEILGNIQNDLQSQEKPLQGIQKAIENITSKNMAGNSAVTAQSAQNNVPSPASALAGLFSTSLLDTVFPEGIDWASPAGQGQSLNSQTTLPLTSLINNAPHAAAPHPTSQNVAATITRIANSGDTKNITIQLDPPDLGKVEIRFEFGKDKTVKANVLIEKPETHLMLQRDAHLLEKALQDAGLETDSDSLNFELSEDNYFDQQANKDSEGHGQSQAGNKSESEDGEELIIESTMDIVIDPDTGLTHVNILA